MTCDDVREALLTASLEEIDALSTHLETCPDCAALARGIRMIDAALNAHVEEFVERPTDTPSSRGGTVLYGVLVVLAAAATLAVVAFGLGGGDTSPGAAPPGVAIADDAVEAFRAMDAGPISVEGLSREDEDAKLRAQLAAKAGALDEVIEALSAVADGDHAPHWRIDALVTQAEVREEMAETLEAVQLPSYLNEEQSSIYRSQVADKADGQRDAALALYRSALDEARGADDADWVDEIEGRLEALTRATPTPQERALRTARGMAPRTRRLVQRVLDAAEACPAAPAAEIGAAMRTVLDQIEGEAWDRHEAWRDAIRAQRAAIEAACPSPE